MDARVALVTAHLDLDLGVGLAHLLGHSEVDVFGDDGLAGGVHLLLMDACPLFRQLGLGIVVALILVLQSLVGSLRVHLPSRLQILALQSR